MKRPLLLALLLAGCAHHATPAEERAEQVMQQAAETPVDLELRCTPEDAEVSVDDVPRGLCSDYARPGAGLRLGSGMHQVAVRKDGYLPYVTYYQPSGARLSLSIQLRPERAGGARP